MKNKEYLEAFHDCLREDEKSPGTISGYLADVKGFLKFVHKPVQKVTRTDVNEYKDELRQLGQSTLTINRKLVSLKQFIDFINTRFHLSISVRVRQEKVQKQYSLKDEELLTQEDYERLIEAVEVAGDLRAKAIFETMYYSGMRVSETLQLRVDHVRTGSRIIVDIKGKGGKYRDIFISDKLLKTLQEYLNVRKQPYSSTTKFLFVGERGPISRQTPHTLMKKYALSAGILPEKAHVHNLRHLFGLRLALKGERIEDIAKYMGHENIDTTKIYLEKPQSYYAERINQL